jgi:hypothetical protein
MGLSLPVRVVRSGGLAAAEPFDAVYLLRPMAGSSLAMTGALFAVEAG